MFRNCEHIDLAKLKDFIETPTQNFRNVSEMKQGVDETIFVLEKNPVAVLNIITGHPYIPSSFILEDLAERMKKLNCIEKLELLFNSCADKLLDACVYNIHDLVRYINSFPGCRDNVMQHLLANRDCVQRILASNSDPEKTLQIISEKFPDCKDAFSECYNKFKRK